MSRQNGAELQTRTVEQPQHRFHLGLRLTPFLLLYAVFQQSATGIQAIVAAGNYLHAAQRDVQMSGPVVAQRSHETAVITAVGMLMVHDMTIRLSLWQSADGRSRMQNIQETAVARGESLRRCTMLPARTVRGPSSRQAPAKRFRTSDIYVAT